MIFSQCMRWAGWVMPPTTPFLRVGVAAGVPESQVPRPDKFAKCDPALPCASPRTLDRPESAVAAIKYAARQLNFRHGRAQADPQPSISHSISARTDAGARHERYQERESRAEGALRHGLWYACTLRHAAGTGSNPSGVNATTNCGCPNACAVLAESSLGERIRAEPAEQQAQRLGD